VKPHFICARDIPDAWFQCLFDIQNPELSRTWTIDQGSYAGQRRMEFNSITVQIKNPCFGQLSERIARMPDHLQGTLPDPIDPPAEDYVMRYFIEYLFSDQLAPGEQYTYGTRIMAPLKVPKFVENNQYHLWQALKAHFPENCQFKENDEILTTQYHAACAYLRTAPGSNQIVLQVAQTSDLALSDPPCLRHIDCRVIEGALHYFIYFRSWDLWGGFPANLAGLSLLMEQMCADTGLTPGQFICHSKGLHLYDHGWDLARLRLGREK
jgi:thymidylate synthase